MCYNMCLVKFVALQGGREQWNTGPPGEPATPVKKEDGWDLIPAGPDLAESNVIDISSSSESESSVSEMSLSSDEEGPPLQEPSPKIARWQAKPSSVSCTCSCVFYNGFLFMKYILAQEDIHLA